MVDFEKSKFRLTKFELLGTFAIDTAYQETFGFIQFWKNYQFVDDRQSKRYLVLPVFNTLECFVK